MATAPSEHELAKLMAEEREHGRSQVAAALAGDVQAVASAERASESRWTRRGRSRRGTRSWKAS